MLTLGFWGAISLIVLFTGAMGSLELMFDAGRNNKSVLLLAFFTIWVLSPFMALFIAALISKHWSAGSRTTLHILILLLSLGSLAGYSGTFSQPATKPAFMFLVIPLVSWLLMATVIPLTRKMSRHHSSRQQHQ